MIKVNEVYSIDANKRDHRDHSFNIYKRTDGYNLQLIANRGNLKTALNFILISLQLDAIEEVGDITIKEYMEIIKDISHEMKKLIYESVECEDIDANEYDFRPEVTD